MTERKLVLKALTFRAQEIEFDYGVVVCLVAS